MEAFVSVADGWDSRLERDELEVMVWLVGQVSAVLSDAASPPDPGTPVDLVLVRERLLPDVSEDPLVALEVGADVRERVAELKRVRMGEVLAELAAPTGQRGGVHVPRGGEADWLACMTDLRQVLAWRLGVQDAEGVQAVHRLVQAADAGRQASGDPASGPGQEPADVGAGLTAQQRDLFAVAYEMVTWWQESLLRVVMGEDWPV